MMTGGSIQTCLMKGNPADQSVVSFRQLGRPFYRNQAHVHPGSHLSVNSWVIACYVLADIPVDTSDKMRKALHADVERPVRAHVEITGTGFGV
jgi:hypothetical protein